MNHAIAGEVWPSMLMIGLLGLLVLSYLVRVRTRGRAHFARVDRQGSGALVTKELMEMVYWGIQPAGRFLVRMKIHPNHVTWASLAFGLAAGLALARGWFGIGAALGVAAAILDALDGLVARTLGISSNSGEVLDATVDRYTEFAFLAGLACFYHRSPWLMLLCLAALHGSYMISYSTAKAEILGIQIPINAMRRPERAAILLIGAAITPLFGAAHQYPILIAVGAVALVSNISALQRFRYLMEASKIAGSTTHAAEPASATSQQAS